jgi:hypothetical protein
MSMQQQHAFMHALMHALLRRRCRACALSSLPCHGTSSPHRVRVRTNAPPRAQYSVATGWFIGKVVAGQNKISKKELEKIPRANFVVQYKRSESGLGVRG